MELEYKKIKPKKLYEEVADVLRGMIARGELKPGDKLESVHKLAENFQVGRSAIREALSALRAMGLVEMKQGEGTYIKHFDLEQSSLNVSSALLMEKTDVINLVEVRKVFETGSVVYAARNRTEADIQKMKDILEEMEQAMGDSVKEKETDIALHLQIAKATHNPLMVSMMKNITNTMQVKMKETREIWLCSEMTTVEDLLNDHKRIVEAIIEQDESKAQKLMENHIHVVEKNVATYYGNLDKK